MSPYNNVLLFVSIIHQFVGTSCYARCQKKPLETIKLINTEAPLNYNTETTEALRVYSVPSKGEMQIGERIVYSQKIFDMFGNTPEVERYKIVNPSGTELEEWQEKGQCKIGKTCKVEGNCWGSGAAICDDIIPDRYVDESSITSRGVIWTKRLYRTCVQEWHCKLSTAPVRYTLHVNKEISAVIEGKTTKISGGARSNFHKDLGYASINVPIPPISRDITMGRCFLGNKTLLFCEITLEGDKAFVDLSEGESCIYLSNRYICVEIPDQKIVLQRYTDNIVKEMDLRQLEQSVRGSFMKSDYNSMMLQRKIIEIRNLLLKLTASVGRFNPMVIRDIFGWDVTSVSNGEYFDIMACLPKKQKECSIDKKKFGGNRNCSELGNEHVKAVEIKLFNETSLEKSFIPDKAGLIGDHSIIAEDIMEHKLMESRDQTIRNSGQTITSWLSGTTHLFDLYNYLSSLLPHINLALIIILHFIKR